MTLETLVEFEAATFAQGSIDVRRRIPHKHNFSARLFAPRTTSPSFGGAGAFGGGGGGLEEEGAEQAVGVAWAARAGGAELGEAETWGRGSRRLRRFGEARGWGQYIYIRPTREGYMSTTTRVRVRVQQRKNG